MRGGGGDGRGCDGEVVSVSSGRSVCADFASFSSTHPLRKEREPRSNLEWSYYQALPGAAASVGEPLVFCHGTSGTAGCFFYQVRALAEKGYHVISAQYPAYSSPEDWCKGFDRFLDSMKCRAAHVFGAGLGGFLLQHFASGYPHRVRSLILCNAFATTRPFADRAGSLASVVYITPTPLLRKVVLDAFPECGMGFSAKLAIDWVARQVGDLSGDDLASRLSLNSTASSVGALALSQARMTLMESNGGTMVPDELRRQLRGLYPGARIAQLKASGDFPYLSDPDEVTLFIEVHLRSAGVFAGGAAAGAGAGASGSGGGGDTGPSAPASTAPAAAKEQPAKFPWTGEPPDTTEQPVQKQPVWKNPFADDLL